MTTRASKTDPWGPPTNLGPTVNSSAGDTMSRISPDGLELYFASWRSRGYGDGDIYVTRRATVNDAWGKPVNLGPVINSYSHDAMSCFSADGLEMYFVSDRPGGWGNFDIWVSTRLSIEDPWGPPANMGAPVNSQYNEVFPSLSSDGLTLYFSDLFYGYNSAPDRPGGLGLHDIWMSTRASRTAPWTTPVNVGAPINTSQRELRPTISADGLELFFAFSIGGAYDLYVSTRADVQDRWGPSARLSGSVNSGGEDTDCSLSPDGLALFFCSNRPGLGGDDLWMSTRKSQQDPWTQAFNLGPMVNSTALEGTPGVSSDMKTLYLGSDRPGGLGGYDLWETPIIPLVDFNGDGIVDATDMCIMVDNWHMDNPLCDIGPAPWGDGIVDVQDLVVLAEHLFEEVLPVELVAYWKLDEAEGDLAYNSTSDNHGTLNGNPEWQPNSGKVAGALQFDGIDDYIATDFVLDPSSGAFSVFAWIKGGASGQVIISQTNGSGSDETWLGITASDGNLMSGLVPPKVGRSVIFPLESLSLITDGLWHHVGFVWDDAYRSLYVDGIEVAKDTQALTLAPLKSATGGLYIGAGKNLNAGTFFSGLIDDVRIYNVALSPEKIAALAQ